MQESEPGINLGRSKLVWKIVAAIVTVVSLTWMLWLLAEVWPDLLAHKRDLALTPLLSGLCVSVLAAYLTFEVFALLVRVFEVSAVSKRQLAHLYFTSQLLKHMPGRFWGIGYQWINERSTTSLGDWLLVNVSLMLLSVFFALWTAWMTLAFRWGTAWGILATVAGALAYFAAWALLSSKILQRWLDCLPVRAATISRRIQNALAKTARSERIKCFALLACGWAAYYGAWCLFGIAYAPVGVRGGLEVCALYLLAWFVGYVSLVTPSGIGVRELVFIWLAKDFSGDAIALMAIIGRSSLLFVDLILGAIFARPSRN